MLLQLLTALWELVTVASIHKIPTLPETARKVARLEKENLMKNNTLHMK
jgi:hypothetical protein